MIVRLTAGGLRGLSAEQSIVLATPDGRSGSGLIVLVGSNNAGKSTFIEALRYLAFSVAWRLPSFTDARRNTTFGDRVELTIELQDGAIRTLRSLRPGGSETEWSPSPPPPVALLILPSRRTFSAYFGDPGQPLARHEYSGNYQVPTLKTATLDHFAGRLFKINRDPVSRREFNELLGKIVSPVPDWTIDQSDSGSYYLKFRWYDASGVAHTHTSDGLGEGLVSLLFVVDSIYDSTPGSTTVIDEPELSLHPQFQRRLRKVLSDCSTDRQIVYATHSPYFVSWQDIANGGNIARIYKGASGTMVAQPTRPTLERIVRLDSLNNPHVLGLDANEVFFLEDRVVLVEGQEDVIYLQDVLEQLEVNLNGTFFGWGVGGAEKMAAVAALLQELGYRSVLGILDADKQERRADLQEKYPDYRFDCIPALDVRPKKARKATEAKSGLVDNNGTLLPEHEAATRALFTEANVYLSARPSASDLRV